MISQARYAYHVVHSRGQQWYPAGPVTQNESLEDATTYVAQFDVAFIPDIAVGLPVEIILVEQLTNYRIKQFTGQINAISATSYPNQVSVTCAGPLAKLRRTANRNQDMSGLDEEDAVHTVLDKCRIEYAKHDVRGSSYTLGQEVPVIWEQGQSAAEFLNELNRVFGFALIELGNGRVVRFRYDLAPDEDRIVREFHRDNSNIYYGGERDIGDIDSIQNVWDVTGAAYDCKGNKKDSDCTCTPFAHGEAEHALLGNNVFTGASSFSSDIIQSHGLAARVAARMMEFYNRVPDLVYIETVNDPTILCGMIIGVEDRAYGMNLRAGRRHPYVITQIDRDGDMMRLSCVGGRHGRIGRIEHGIDKECTELATIDSEFDNLDAIDPPEIPPTPLPEPPALEVPDDFPSIEELDLAPLDVPELDDLGLPEIPELGDLTPPPLPLPQPIGEWGDRCAFTEEVPAGEGVNYFSWADQWRISGTMTLTPGVTNPAFIGALASNADGLYGLQIMGDPGATKAAEIWMAFDKARVNLGTEKLDEGVPFTFEVVWTLATKTIEATINQEGGAGELTNSVSYADSTVTDQHEGTTYFDIGPPQNPHTYVDPVLLEWSCEEAGEVPPGATDGCMEAPFEAGVAVDGTKSIRLTGEITFVNHEPVEIGFHGADGDYWLRTGTSLGSDRYAEFGGADTGTEVLDGTPFFIGDRVGYVLCWDATTKTLKASVTMIEEGEAG